MIRFPGCLILLCCPKGARCDRCSKVPEQNLVISDFVRETFHNVGPIMVKEGEKFLTLDELMARKKMARPQQPSDYSEFRCCLLCNSFYYLARADILRHRTFMHPDSSLLQVCAQPFQCLEMFPREKDAEGMPWGELKYCKERFSSVPERADHWKVVHNKVSLSLLYLIRL